MRYFVTFKANTTAKNNVMVFTNIQRTSVQDTMQQLYYDLWHKIYTEQEASQIIPQIYCQEELWIPFGSEVKLTEELHKVSLQPITNWFKTAKPNPKPKDLPTQLGAHFEEVAEMISATYGDSMPDVAIEAYNAISALSERLYKEEEIEIENLVELLDSLADQVVTATGVAYFSNFKFDEALTEVNKSNYSKFEDNKPLLNQDGKIIKGKNYFKPEIKDYV